MDFGAALRKLFGDESADVIPGVNFKQVNNVPSGFVTEAQASQNKYIPEQQIVRPTDAITPIVDPAAVAAAQAASRLASLRGSLTGKRGAVNDAYAALFGDLDTLGRERASEVEKTAGENINKLTGQYTSSIPKIDASYAALGSYDSTNRGDARTAAQNSYEDSVKQVGKQKEDDLSKVGSYISSNKANYGADRDSILRLIDQASQSDNEADIRQASNDIDNKLGQAQAARGSLMTDAGARGELSKLTGDAGRYEAIANSLDSIMQSSLAGGVKAAAALAAANAQGLSDEDKAKIKLQYGNVYDTPAAA